MPTDSSAGRLRPTDRTALRRKKERGSHDRELINAVLDEALVCHVGFTTERGPVVLPMFYARIGDDLFVHGAAANDMLRHLDSGAQVCITVTLLDALVFARSAFHHSVNYRSVVLFGVAERVTDPTTLRRVSDALVDHLAPGRSGEARPPTDEELRATRVVRLSINEGSAKVRTGGPIDDADDMALPVWAGALPVRLRAGHPVTDAQGREQPGVPAYISAHPLLGTP